MKAFRWRRAYDIFFMEQLIKSLLDKAWKKFLDDYEVNPVTHEEPLSVKVSKVLSDATVCERDLICFIDRNRYHVFSLEFADGKPTNFNNIATKISES